MEDYYSLVEAKLKEGKDSIFEPCEIRNFDTSTMTAEVFFVRSKQTRKNTVVLFPAFFQDSGIFTVPLDGTKAIAFWGADNQVFVFPVQYNLPSVVVDDGVTKLDSTTKNSDSTTALDFLTKGEYLIKSPAGSYLYMDALKNIEISTESFRFIRIEDGSGMMIAGIEGYDIEADFFSEVSEPLEVEGETGQRYTLSLKKGSVDADSDTMSNIDYAIDALASEGNEDAVRGITFNEPKEMLKIEKGLVFDVVDGEKTFRKINADENVVYSLSAGNGKIEVGENGTFKLSSGNSIIQHGDKTYTVSALIDRLELISTLLEIPNPLSEAGD